MSGIMLDPENQELKDGHRRAMAGFGSSVVKSPEDAKANNELMARAWAAGAYTRPLFS